MPGYLEKTMNGDQTESNRTSCRSRSKVVSKMDPTRSLELAVMDYKKDANDKNWSNIEKVLQVNCLQQLSIQVNTSINIHQKSKYPLTQFIYISDSCKDIERQIDFLMPNIVNGHSMDTNCKR